MGYWNYIEHIDGFWGISMGCARLLRHRWCHELHDVPFGLSRCTPSGLWGRLLLRKYVLTKKCYVHLKIYLIVIPCSILKVFVVDAPPEDPPKTTGYREAQNCVSELAMLQHTVSSLQSWFNRCWDGRVLPSGKLTWLWQITMFNG